MPSTPDPADAIIALAETRAIEIPENVLTAVRSASQGSQLQQWVKSLIDQARVLKDDNRLCVSWICAASS
jgi:hypothetical protein